MPERPRKRRNLGFFSGRTTRSATLTAAGERIDLTNRDVVNRLAATRKGWQTQAWDYRDLIGELSGAIRWRANVISKVTFVAAQVVDDATDPVAITSEHCTLKPQVKAAAQAAMDALPLRSGYGFAGVLSTGFDVAGEAWLHGWTVHGRERWEALSSEAVKQAGTGHLGIVRVPGAPITPMADDEVLMRLWVPHPRYTGLSDSPCRGLADVFEDIVLIGRELRAAARSRIAANGLLLMPDSMTLLRRGTDPQPTTGDDADDFQVELEAAMLAPIANEGDAGSVVPIVVKGDPVDLKEIRHITLSREDSPTLSAKLQGSLARMFNSLDMPPQMATGDLGDANHWNASIITAGAFTDYVEPGVRVLADSLTEAYLYNSLVLPTTAGGWGLSHEDASSVRVWFDATAVTENANKAADADSVYDRGELSGDSLRKSHGFADEDKPSDEDLRRMFAWRAAGTDQTGGHLLATVLGQPDLVPVQATATRTPPAVDPPPQPALPAGAPAGSRTASAQPEPPLSVRVVTSAALARVDADLMERITQAADDACLRALEKAVSRIRSKAQSRGDLRAVVDTADLYALPAALEQHRPGVVGELGLVEDVILAAAFAYLAGKFIEWTTSAITATAKIIGGLVNLPLTLTAALVSRMSSRIASAWQGLEHALRRRVMDRLYGRAGDEQRGEVGDTLAVPGDVRAALDEIGGGTRLGGSGIGTGDDSMTVLRTELGPPMGIMWDYRESVHRNTLPPHRALDGRRFDSNRDPRLAPPAGYEWLGERMHPGDHDGCRCTLTQAWLFPRNASAMDPDLRTLMAEVIGDESLAMRQIRALAEQDDAAGRVGTTAQRTRDQRDYVLRTRTEWLQGVGA